MRAEVDPSQLYGKWYYDNYAMPYEQANWAALFAHVANGIRYGLNPKTVLDAGCAKGFLVAALRDQGIDAYGVDVSDVAIANAPEPVRPYVRVGSLTSPLGQRVDLVTCIEVIEHLDPTDAATAVGHLCAASDAVLLSTTPGDQDEATHVNVQPSERWATLFASYGFFRDFDHDATYVAPWAVLYRRLDKALVDVVVDYERSSAELRVEAHEQRARLAELRDGLEALLRSEPFEIDELRTELAALRHEVDDLRRRGRDAEVRLGAIYGQIVETAALVNRYHGNEERLGAILASKSWRLVKLLGMPLRVVRPRAAH